MDVADFPVRDENVRIVQDCLHGLGVGDHVRREVAAVKLHPLDDLDGGADGVGLLDGDDAVFAHLLHGLEMSLPISSSPAEIAATCAMASLRLDRFAQFVELLDDRGEPPCRSLA